jgi:hypothetical protein
VTWNVLVKAGETNPTTTCLAELGAPGCVEVPGVDAGLPQPTDRSTDVNAIKTAFCMLALLAKLGHQAIPFITSGRSQDYGWAEFAGRKVGKRKPYEYYRAG